MRSWPSRRECGNEAAHRVAVKFTTISGANFKEASEIALVAAVALQGASRRRQFSTTVRGRDGRQAPDLVDRNFTATPLVSVGATRRPISLSLQYCLDCARTCQT
jgi:hypothetical protein